MLLLNLRTYEDSAFADVLSAPFRGVLLKSLGITLLALIAAWFGLEWLIDHLVTLERGWLDTRAVMSRSTAISVMPTGLKAFEKEELL